MARTLVALLISVLLSQAFCLECNTCQGEYDCVGETVTCQGPWASCSTSVRKASVSFMNFQTIKKGCASQLYPQESISIKSHMMSLSYQSRFCSQDGCNNETYFVSHPAPANHMRCHTCTTQGPWCPEGARSQISCVGDQDQCLNLDFTGNMGQFTNMKLRGCASLPRCQDTLSFISGSRTIHATCCDTPLCNSFTPDLHLHSQATNGLECYSCVDGDGTGSGCSDENIGTVQCTGSHNMCLEGVGNSRKGNKDLVMTFKGCASEAMCQSNLLALVQEIDDAEVLCCQGNLCNTRIVNGVVTAPRVAADSPNLTEADECIAPTTTASTPDHTISSNCLNEDEEDEAGIVHAPPGIALSPENHIDNETSAEEHFETHMINETECNENLTTTGNTETTSFHPGNTDRDEHESHDDLFTGYSEVVTASPNGAVASGHIAMGNSSANTNLDENHTGAGTTSPSNHGSVVVLVPVIVPKRNATMTTSSSETTTTKEVLGISNNDEAEFEECEEGEESTGQHFITSKEHGPASTQSAEGNVALGDDPSNAGVFTAEGHESSHSPTTGIAGNTDIDNSRIVHSRGTTGDSYPPRPGHSGTGSYGATHENVVATSGENFAAGGGAFTANASLPNSYVISKENNNFGTESGAPATTGADTPTSTSNTNKEVLVPGNGVVTSRPKNKIPCKRPGSQRQPSVNLMSSSEAKERVPKEGTARNDASHSERNVPGKTNFPDKTNPYSGAFGLAANLGLFSVTIFLATLLH